MLNGYVSAGCRLMRSIALGGTGGRPRAVRPEAPESAAESGNEPRSASLRLLLGVVESAYCDRVFAPCRLEAPMFASLAAASLLAGCPGYLDGACSGVTAHTPGSVVLTAGENAPSSVRWNGAELSLPRTLTGVKPGVYLLELSHPDYPPSSRWVTVRPGEKLRLGLTVCGLGRAGTPEGRCCLSGQTLVNGQCSGAVFCSYPYDGQSCALSTCPEGTVRLPGGLCCEPGERPDFERFSCTRQAAPRCAVGFVASFDRCVRSARFSDSDGDHVSDANDNCPKAPEDLDDFQDDDGCPDLDDDGDGVPDAVDRCRSTPEDKDGFEDGDGCPDLDDDRDGVPDAVDRCRREPEDDPAGTDGCPQS